MKKVEVTLYSRPGCHLCETALLQLEELSKKLSAVAEIGITEITITSDPSLEKKYSEYIPVILIDGQVHDYFAVNEERFTQEIIGKSH
jgi:coenzyme F420-reducing hydrogenase gamma subunit